MEVGYLVLVGIFVAMVFFGIVILALRRGREVTREVAEHKYREAEHQHLLKELQLAQFASDLPASRGTAQKSIFMSYRREDAPDITGRLYDRLTSELGRGVVFKDIDSIPIGSDFRSHIDENLNGCHIFLAVIGQRWAGATASDGRRRIDDPRDFVRLELETALRRNIPVIPILVHDAPFPEEQSLPDGLREIAYRQALRLRSDPDFHRDADRLVEFLKSQL